MLAGSASDGGALTRPPRSCDPPPRSSRLEWPKDHYFPPCELKFRDGWEPPAATASQELSHMTERLVHGRRGGEPTARQREVSGLGWGLPATSCSHFLSVPPQPTGIDSSYLQIQNQDGVHQDPDW